LLPREVFQVDQDPGPKAETTGRGRDPHPLDLAVARVALQGAAPDRLSVQRGQDEVAARRRELLRRRRYAERGVVAGFEPGRELLEVALETILRRRTVGLRHRDEDGASGGPGQGNRVRRRSAIARPA